MTRLLAVNWNVRMLQYVHAETNRRGNLKALSAGAEEIPGDPAADPSLILKSIQQLITRQKAEKSQLLILLNRGAVDSATFTVPPATESELPALVRNLAAREIPGTTDDSPVDFIAYPPAADGSRTISAMALVADEQQLVQRLISECGCRSVRILVGTHPLRAFVQPEQQQQCSLVISRGQDAADVLLTEAGLPILSRTIRLAAGVRADDINRYLVTETQRTLISAGGQTPHPLRVEHIRVAGNEQETEGLDIALSGFFEAEATVVTPTSLVDISDLSTDQILISDSGSFAGLYAALYEAASQKTPAIDFASPRRPVVKASSTKRILVAAGSLTFLLGGVWFYIASQLSDIDDENRVLLSELNELSQVVRDSQSKRRLAAALQTWEDGRISWPDELRDLTMRFPPAPDLRISQLSISSAGIGRAVISFRGTATQPEVIQQLEARLRDRFHDLKIPGIREQKDGNKSAWTFQTTMTVRRRSPGQYGGTSEDKDTITETEVEASVKHSSVKGPSDKGPDTETSAAESPRTVRPERDKRPQDGTSSPGSKPEAVP